MVETVLRVWRLWPVAASVLACAFALVVGGPAVMGRLRAIMRRQAGGG